MCGIIGVIGTVPDEKTFAKARDTMAHRGPDDVGLYHNQEKGSALGHRRLSIIDLSQDGRQPFWSADKRYAIVFNGEIYNYCELRSELEGKYNFITKTDTEVLLAAYTVGGQEALKKLNGMFAFAVWDAQEQKLFAARDRLGVKPFHYHVADGTFSFASEIKALLALGITAQVNESAVYDYLSQGLYDHRTETFFDGIVRLPAGHYLIWEQGTLTITSYWDLKDVAKEPSLINLSDAKEKFLTLFADSIRLRLRSDVPAGVNLSSGLDSAAILYFTEKFSEIPLKLFSMKMDDPDYDEATLIEQTLADSQKKRWYTSTLAPQESIALMGEVVHSQEEPFGGIPTITYHKLAQLEKKEGVTVILEGQGGDELLAGYRYFKPEFLLEEGPRRRSQDTTIEVKANILDEKFSAQHAEWVPPQPFESVLLNAQYRDLMYTKLPRVLRFNDRLSMASSREYRQPYLDYRLVEFCFFLSDDLKIRGDEQKFLLREAMRDIVPVEMRSRPKKTFGAIQTPWLRGELREWAQGILSSSSFKSRPYFNHTIVEKEVQKFFAGEGDNSFALWQWINLELWLREFID